MTGCFIGGLIDGWGKIKKQREKDEMERQRKMEKQREKWKRIANGNKQNDDFDPIY